MHLDADPTHSSLFKKARARLAGAGLFFVAAFALLAMAAPAGAQGTFQTPAPSAILVDFSTGAILFEKDADRRMAPGSLVKIMTAAVVFNELQAGRITPDTPFMVSVNAWRRGGGPSGGAAMFAEVNKPVRVEDLLIGALTVSGNDAAIALAEGVSGTETAFAMKMNELGAAIGLTNSSFRNAQGFADPDQVSTAKDMAQLARYVIRTFPKFYPLFSVPDIEWSKIKQRNRNPLLNAGVGADGLQAAWLRDAGYHIVGSAQQSNRRLIVAVMGAKTEKERLEEAKRLLEWGFHSFEYRQLFAAGAELGRANVFGGDAGSVAIAPRDPVMLLLPRNTPDKIVSRVTYNSPLRAPIAKGTEVAKLEILRGQMKVLEVPLVTTEEVAVGTLWQRALDGATVTVGDTARDLTSQLLAKFKK